MFSRRSTSYSTITNVIFALTVFLGSVVTTFAQSLTLTSGHTPPGVAPGNPNGNYPLSDIDDVNLFNGNVRIVLPLASVGGRGSAGFAPTLRIESLAWQARQYVEGPPASPTIWKAAEYYSTSSNAVGYSPGTMLIVRATDNPQPNGYVCQEGDTQGGYVLKRLKFVTTDGTEIWFHDQLYGGWAQPYNWCTYNTMVNRKRLFITSNGEAMTFISDWTLAKTGR